LNQSDTGSPISALSLVLGKWRRERALSIIKSRS
jgi:hypothetical protein